MDEKTNEVSSELKCANCGAILKFAPGKNSLQCEYCGASNIIDSLDRNVVIEEIDFEAFDHTVEAADKQTISTVKCDSCGASTTLKPNVTSDSCPFCGTSLVIKSGSTKSILKPKYLLPFKIEQKAALQHFKKWINSLWFAPNDLKLYANSTDKLSGMYIPYWTYDSICHSSYQGMRGMNYTETYTTEENGKTVTRTRTKIHWAPCHGNVVNEFDDLLIMASHSLPEDYANALEPWDLDALTDFSEKYLSGFRAETYQVEVKPGFEKAKNKMETVIRQTVCNDIGGDHQQISFLTTRYSNVTFKHILLPIWISAYRYGQKVYRFMINGRTGEVQGQRPWSIAKIAGAVVLTIAIILVVYFFSKK